MTSDAAFESLTDEILQARRALLALTASEPGKRWHPYELKTRARNGWSASAMGLALDGLIDEGSFEVHDDLLVSLPRQ